MKKTIQRIAALALSVVTLAGSNMVVHADEGYTYGYDYWGDVQYSPDVYKTISVYTDVELGLDKKLNAPQGLFVVGQFIYLCDTGNNRILEMERKDEDTIELVRVIDHITGDVADKEFQNPTDIAVSEEGFLYIADRDNNRILKLDSDGNYVMEFTKPADATFDQSLSFFPSKIAVDSAGRVYCVATNANKGLIKYESDGTFAGFVGATPVTYDWTDYIWKKLATQEQRAKMESFVPTEYDNVFMDYEGFIYA